MLSLVVKSQSPFVLSINSANAVVPVPTVKITPLLKRLKFKKGKWNILSMLDNSGG
jgi:hypothetical protein